MVIPPKKSDISYAKCLSKTQSTYISQSIAGGTQMYHFLTDVIRSNIHMYNFLCAAKWCIVGTQTINPFLNVQMYKMIL